MEPVAVAARLIAQGGEDEQDEKHVEGQQPLPVFLHKQLKVHEGAQQVDRDTQEDGDALDDHRAVVLIVPGGGEDHRHTEAAGQQAEGQEHQIPLFQKLMEWRE